MAFRSRLKPVRVRVRLTPRLTALDAAIAALDALLEQPEVLQKLLRAAVIETILASWRERFLDNLADAVNMERTAGAVTSADSPELDRAKVTLADAAKALTEAQHEGLPVRGAKGKVTKAEKALVKAITPGGSGALSTGQFRVRAMQVLRALSEIAVQSDGDRVQLGIGYLPTLEAIKTPSATPMLTGHETDSEYNTLWKHLEFGTGAYATGKFNQAAPTRRGDGGWWYGPRKGFGISLKGSKGVHAVIDPATGVPYMQDALRFETVFGAMFARALSGK